MYFPIRVNISLNHDPTHIKTIPSKQPRIILNIHYTQNIHRNQGNEKEHATAMGGRENIFCNHFYKHTTAKAVEIPTHLHLPTLLPFIIPLCRS
jgi:hypothetical protein